MSLIANRFRIIRREDVMGNGIARAAVVAWLALVPSIAGAQARAARPIEIGGGIGTVGEWVYGEHASGGDLRVTLPLAARGDLELLAAMGGSPDRWTQAVGLYAGQFRLHLGEWSGDVRPFLTFGAMGIFSHSSRYGTSVSPPLLGLVGAGAERRVSRHLIVRGDVQSIVLVVLPIGVRVAAGVSIPVGSPRP